MQRLCKVHVVLAVLLTVATPCEGAQAPRKTPPPSPKAAEALQLLESDDPHQQRLGFLRLEALREPSTVEAVQRYVSSRDPEVRALGVRAVAAIEGPPAVGQLLELLKRERHPRVRGAVLLALEPFQKTDPAILPVFIKALRDRRTEVRMTAVDLVSRIDDPRAREAVLARNTHERRRDVRRVLDLAMKRLATD